MSCSHPQGQSDHKLSRIHYPQDICELSQRQDDSIVIKIIINAQSMLKVFIVGNSCTMTSYQRYSSPSNLGTYMRQKDVLHVCCHCWSVRGILAVCERC